MAKWYRTGRPVARVQIPCMPSAFNVAISFFPISKFHAQVVLHAMHPPFSRFPPPSSPTPRSLSRPLSLSSLSHSLAVAVQG